MEIFHEEISDLQVENSDKDDITDILKIKIVKLTGEYFRISSMVEILSDEDSEDVSY